MTQSNKASALTGISIANVAGIGRTGQERLKEVDEDANRSPQGKAQASQAVRSDTDKELAGADQSYRDGIARLRADLQSTLDGQKPKRSEVDKVRALGMYDSLDNRQLGLLIAETSDVNARALRDTAQQIIAAGLDQKGLMAALERAFNSGDQDALSNLGEVARFRGDQDGIKRAQGYIDALREASLTIPQKIARAELKRLDTHQALFDQAVEYARKGGRALDLLESGQGLRDADERIDFEIKSIQLGAKPEGGSD